MLMMVMSVHPRPADTLYALYPIPYTLYPGQLLIFIRDIHPATALPFYARLQFAPHQFRVHALHQ